MTAPTPFERLVLGRVAGQEIPRYRSPEFDACDDVHLRAASVLRAAMAWVDHCSPAQVALDVLAQMEEQEREIRRRIREASWDVAGAVDWTALAASPSHAELQRRRGEAA